MDLERYDEALKDLKGYRAKDSKGAGVEEWILRAEHWSNNAMSGGRKNYYKILAVPMDAPLDAIRKAHKRMALLWHPDKAAADDREDHEAKFKEVQEAWEFLQDEGKREIYDFGKKKPTPELLKPMPAQLQRMGYTVRKGNGIDSCMICGFKASTEQDKRIHTTLQKHPGFYETNPNPPKFVPRMG